MRTTAWIAFWVFISIPSVLGADRSPQRVVALAPSLAEIAGTLLRCQHTCPQIVGVSDYTDAPKGLRSKPPIGPYHQFNIERVVSLKPDLVLATEDGNPKNRIDRLTELGFKVVTVKSESLADIRRSIQTIGEALGHVQEARDLEQEFDKKLQRYRARAQERVRSGRPAPTVLIQVGSKPLVVAGKKSFLTEGLEWIGARNIYEGQLIPYPRPSFEDVVAKNPDVILVLGMSGGKGETDEMVREWKRFRKLRAVQKGRIYSFDGDLFLRPTIRMVDHLEALEKAIYEDSKS